MAPRRTKVGRPMLRSSRLLVATPLVTPSSRRFVPLPGSCRTHAGTPSHSFVDIAPPSRCGAGCPELSSRWNKHRHGSAVLRQSRASFASLRVCSSVRATALTCLRSRRSCRVRAWSGCRRSPVLPRRVARQRFAARLRQASPPPFCCQPQPKSVGEVSEEIKHDEQHYPKPKANAADDEQGMRLLLVRMSNSTRDSVVNEFSQCHKAQ